MNKIVKVCYSIRRNFGNALNPILIEKVFGRKVVWADEYCCETSGIGSGLRLFFKKELQLDAKRKSSKNPPCQLWSAGFLSTPQDDIVPIREFNIASVRGILSKSFLEKLYNKTLEITTGDAGLLASELIDNNLSSKKYKLGIIPHDRERQEPHFKNIYNNNSDCVIIDVQDDPLSIIKTMSMCECIISSSLHGLVVADSLGIPNRWIKLTDKLLGDGFKFHDYYSTFGIEVQLFDLNGKVIIDYKKVIEGYQLTPSMIEKKKQEIITAFNMYL